MKPREQNSHSCGAESVAAMTLIGAIAQSLALLGLKYEAAVYSALDAAASGLEIMAMGPAASEDTDYVEALRIVELLREHMTRARAESPSAKAGWRHT